MATTSSSKPKIVVLGDMAVGKTSILKQFISQKFSTHHKATLGADFMEKMVQLPDRVVALQLWDTCGQERFDSLGLAYYRGSDGCILVYDVTNPKSLENLKNWKAKFLEIVGAASKPVFICLGNKSDLEHAVTPAEAQAAAKDLGCHHEFVSAKTGENIEQVFKRMARETMDRAKSSKPLKTETVDVNVPEAGKKGGCC